MLGCPSFFSSLGVPHPRQVVRRSHRSHQRRADSVRTASEATGDPNEPRLWRPGGMLHRASLSWLAAWPAHRIRGTPGRSQKLDFRHKLYALREERVMKPHVFAAMVKALLYEKRYAREQQHQQGRECRDCNAEPIADGLMCFSFCQRPVSARSSLSRSSPAWRTRTPRRMVSGPRRAPGTRSAVSRLSVLALC